MDIHLAGAMDGLEAARRLRAEQGPPVLFMTAFGTAEVQGEARAISGLDILQKPVSQEQLRLALEAALDRWGISR